MSQFRRQVTAAMVRRDALVALALGVSGALLGVLMKVAQGEAMAQTPSAALILASLVIAIALIWRRRYPTAAAIAVTVLYGVFMELEILEFTVSQIVLFLPFYSLGAWEHHRRRAWWTRLVIVVAMAIWLVYGAIRGFSSPETGELGVQAYFSFLAVQVALNAAYFSAGWVFGDRTWQQSLEQQQLRDAHAEIRAQQVQITEQAVAMERVRIARELHDVVAHHVSTMGIQAGAARRVLTTDSERAGAALRSVEQSARSAIAELGMIVGALRGKDDGDAPMPTLADLPALIAASREHGSTTFHEVGERFTLSPIVELTAYRVVQEALTNVRKHAGLAATADVRIRYLDQALEVEVSDNGHGAVTAVPGLGVGHTGMKERVAAVGGTIEIGPKSRGGYLVRAHIPVAGPTGDKVAR